MLLKLRAVQFSCSVTVEEIWASINHMQEPDTKQRGQWNGSAAFPLQSWCYMGQIPQQQCVCSHHLWTLDAVSLSQYSLSNCCFLFIFFFKAQSFLGLVSIFLAKSQICSMAGNGNCEPQYAVLRNSVKNTDSY